MHSQKIFVIRSKSNPKKLKAYFARRIGEGSSGEVYRTTKVCFLEKGQLIKKANHETKIIKVYKKNGLSFKQQQTAAQDEFEITKQLDVTDYYKVRLLYNNTRQVKLPDSKQSRLMTDSVFLLKERCMAGENLHKVVESKKIKTRPQQLAYAIGFVREVVKRIHRYKIVNLDLKPANTIATTKDLHHPIISLIDNDMAVKPDTRLEEGRGTNAYVAPEMLKPPTIANEKCDGFSTAISLSEIFFGHEIFHNIFPNAIRGLNHSLGYALSQDPSFDPFPFPHIKNNPENDGLLAILRPMVSYNHKNRPDLLESLDQLEALALDLEILLLPDAEKQQREKTLAAAQQLRRAIEEAPYSAKSRNEISNILANNPDILSNKEQLTIFTDTLNMDGVKDCKSKEELEEKVKSSCYLESIIYQVHHMESGLNINQKKYVRLLKKELITLKNDLPHHSIRFDDLITHVEARIFTYYCHSMQHEGWKISRFRTGLEEIMNNEALLFRQNYGIRFKHPGTTRDFNLKAKLERLSSLENNDLIPIGNPVRSSRVMDIELDAIDKDIFNNALRASFQPSNSASHMDHRIDEIAKQIRDSRPVFSKEDKKNKLDLATLKNTDKVCYRHCMKFLIQLNTIKTTRNDKKAELKVAIIDLLRRSEIGKAKGELALKICLFDAYTAIRRSESEQKKPLSFFHKSSNLGDFLRKFMIELGVGENLIPRKYNATTRPIFLSTRGSFNSPLLMPNDNDGRHEQPMPINNGDSHARMPANGTNGDHYDDDPMSTNHEGYQAWLKRQAASSYKPKR